MKVADGVGNAPTSRVMVILFSKQVQPAYICLPSNGVAGRICTRMVRLRRALPFYSSHNDEISEDVLPLDDAPPERHGWIRTNVFL